MRRPLALAALLIISTSVFAEDAPARRTRLTWEARFTMANAAHDGHLTLEEARSGFKTVARHFQEIDTDSKGFVTENDIRAWHAAKRLARHSQTPEDPLRPRPAFERKPADQRTMAITTGHKLVMIPEQSDRRD